MLNIIFELIVNLLEGLIDYLLNKNPKKTKIDKQTKDLNQELGEIINPSLKKSKNEHDTDLTNNKTEQHTHEVAPTDK